MIRIRGWAAGLLALGLGGSAPAQEAGTAFTYQGRLSGTLGPVTGTCDFEFRLFSVATGGSQLGQSNQTLAVATGLFATSLDFGAAFPGPKRWLEAAVRCPAGAGAFTVLPRQELTPTPYAIRSASSAWAGLTGVPSGFADDLDNDVLASLACGTDQAVRWTGSQWACASVQLLTTTTSCSNTGVSFGDCTAPACPAGYVISGCGCSSSGTAPAIVYNAVFTTINGSNCRCLTRGNLGTSTGAFGEQYCMKAALQ
jgi:hypothetical protein